MVRPAARRLAVLALVAGTAAVFYVLVTGGPDHRFSVVVPAAANLVKGNEVNADGAKVGTVTAIEPVDGGRSARVEMTIADEEVWPLPRDSQVELRLGGTVSFTTRYVLLEPGDSSEMIPEDGELPPQNAKIPVEVDDVVSYVTPKVQDDLQGFIGNGSEVMEQGGDDLRQALVDAPPVLQDATGLLQDLVRNDQDLSTLVTSTGRIVDGVNRSTPDVRVLLSGLAETLDATAAESDDLGLALERFPDAMRQTRTTLQTADVALKEVGVLTDRLAPGIDELRQTTAPLTRVLASLRAVTPGARDTLAAVDASDPLSAGLERIAPLVPRIGSIGEQATTELDCVRPYAPELAAFGSTWGDWMTPVDSRDHVVRATVQSFLPANYNSVPETPEQVVARNPGLEYGFPRPPGMLAGQPWFQPQCGAGPEALDPANDMEGKQFSRDQLPPEAGTP